MSTPRFDAGVSNSGSGRLQVWFASPRLQISSERHRFGRLYLCPGIESYLESYLGK